MAGSGRRRESILWPLAVLALAGGAVALGLGHERTLARSRVAHEDASLAVARTLGRAERSFRERTGRFGWLEELRDADLLTGMDTRASAHGLQVLASGYQLDVLLPSARALAGEIPLGTHAAGPAELSLVAEHFAVVARPERPGLDGFRIWYLDEEGRVFLCEGVSDVEGSRDNALPGLRVTRSHDQQEPGTVWRRADEVGGD